uniref:RNA helicase n=1 Tax=Ditylenchus dipsaci TaxID=166011 RepID=A0A915DAM9_9BILA
MHSAQTGGGGDRSGFGAGNAASAAFDSNYTDDKPSHVPVMRTIENIFEEDEKMCEKYSTIRIEDDEITISGQGDEAPTMIEAWADGNLQESLLANINRAKYVLPRKIQSYTIPLIMDGYDVKGHAETGSGKTAAFLIPIIDTIIKKKAAEEMKSERSKPIALIIEPTRELAIQLHDQARKLAEGTGVSVAVAYGKYQYRDNLRHVSMGCDILVGTPGRLKDFILKRYVMVENLKYLVIDEADELLEDQFMRDIRDISNVEKFPRGSSTLLFSATFPELIQEWANEWMRPKNVMVSNKKLTTANHRVRQDFHLVAESEKKTKLLEMLNEELAELKKAEPDNEDLKLRKTLIFVKLKRTCDVLCSYLQQNKFTSTTINGDRTQEQRENCLNQLRNGEVQVVVTTDVCARGIDIKNLDHVINMDLPETYVSYIHRIGRTARLKEGTATSFFDPLADMDLAGPLVKGIKDVGQEVPEFLEKAADGTLEYQPHPRRLRIWC